MKTAGKRQEHREERSWDKNRVSPPPPYFLLFLAAGIYGVLLCIGDIPGISYSEGLVFVSVSVFCVVLWASFFYRPVWFWFFALLTALTWAAAVFFEGERLSTEFGQIAEALGSGGTGGNDVT